jgi:hypothetical protein
MTLPGLIAGLACAPHRGCRPGGPGLVHIGLARSLLAPTLRGDIALARDDRPGLRVLFVGNSFTFKNSLPALVHDLAAGDPGATPISSVEYAAPGWSLHQAAKDDGLAKLLQEVHWDVVVLQEKSWRLSFPEDRWRRETYPSARDLREKISAVGARTLLFMTWGYALGDRWHEPHDTYAAMQARLADGYSKLGAEVAPAGLAWAEALRRRPYLDLWAGDGQHPSLVSAHTSRRACFTPLSPGGSRLEAASRRESSLGKLVFSRRSPRTCASRAFRAGLPRDPDPVLKRRARVDSC